jgi:hypothetical protein
MEDASNLSKLIRAKKNKALRPDLDDAGQEGVQPTDAFEAMQADEVNKVLGEPEIESASKEERDGDTDSQDPEQLKRAMSRIQKYINSL